MRVRMTAWPAVVSKINSLYRPPVTVEFSRLVVLSISTISLPHLRMRASRVRFWCRLTIRLRGQWSVGETIRYWLPVSPPPNCIPTCGTFSGSRSWPSTWPALAIPIGYILTALDVSTGVGNRDGKDVRGRRRDRLPSIQISELVRIPLAYRYRVNYSTGF